MTRFWQLTLTTYCTTENSSENDSLFMSALLHNDDSWDYWFSYPPKSHFAYLLKHLSHKATQFRLLLCCFSAWTWCCQCCWHALHHRNTLKGETGCFTFVLRLHMTLLMSYHNSLCVVCISYVRPAAWWRRRSQVHTPRAGRRRAEKLLGVSTFQMLLVVLRVVEVPVTLELICSWIRTIRHF